MAQHTDGYDNVRIAILTQAIKDYKRALKRKSTFSVRAYERWFLSAWGEMLSGGNGAYIIEKTKNQVIGGKRKNGRKQN